MAIMFAITLSATLSIWAQGPSFQQQYKTDVDQDMKIAENSSAIDRLNAKVDKLILNQEEQKTSIEGFKGICEGFGAAITILQGLGLIVQVKARKG